MLHAYAARFDVTGNLENFWKLNKALLFGSASPSSALNLAAFLIEIIFILEFSSPHII